MKKIKAIVIVAVMTVVASWCGNAEGVPQLGKKGSHDIVFTLTKSSDSVLYMGVHFRDELIVLDSATVVQGKCEFKGKGEWQRGIYSLMRYEVNKKKKDRKLVSLTDFTIDDSQKFTIAADSTFGASKMRVTGSKANKLMYEYLGTLSEARALSKELGARIKSADSVAARRQQDSLSEAMVAYEKRMLAENGNYRFFQLVKQMSGPEVPEGVENKPVYYRTHYWDGVDLKDHSLIYTPDLFNKMNYYFYGILYHADSDTISRYTDLLMDRMEGDTVMMRYVFDFIMPRYYRSTKNIGWDAVWCYLVRNYYLKGRCPWATEGDISNKRQTAAFLEKSLIGAYGQELIMSDTTQLPSRQFSSHRMPYKYVILWFWDPDCHHCQEQTAALIELYNRLDKEGTRNFEVYAVGYEADVAKWKRYVKDHNLPFVNVGGPNVNIDYQEAYNVHGAPTMIILNADRQIIMNKTIPAASLLPFIEQYEKQHPEQKDRQPSFWQMQSPIGVR